MQKIKTIVKKEWAEVFKNRMVLFTVLFLPLLLTALPLIILGATAGSGASNVATDLPKEFSSYCPANLNASECFQVYMVSQFMVMFMILPLAIPATISAYSIVGEKTTHSLEPLLATPITTEELLIGKGLAAAIPAVVATYVAFLIYVIGAWIMIQNKALFAAILDTRWLIAVFILGPLMSILAILISMMISSRVNDPRVAEQLSMLVILPVLAIFFGQLSGLVILNSRLVSIIAVVLAVIDVVLVYLAVHVFQREVILTRWK